MIKRIFDTIVGSIIEIGQALLNLDGIGFDAMCITILILGLNDIRNRISKTTSTKVDTNKN